MAEIDSGGETGKKFGGVTVTGLTNEQYAAIESTAFHVYTRDVAAGENNRYIYMAWNEVPKRTD